MSELTPNDVRRWDSTAVRNVFQAAGARADTLNRLGENLDQVDAELRTWEGEAGDAFRVEIGKARTDIESDGRASHRVAAAVATASQDVDACKAAMREIDETAEANGWTITNGWKVDIGDTWLLMGAEVAELQRQILQSQLDALKIRAHATDHELATALRAAVGEAQVDERGRDLHDPANALLNAPMDAERRSNEEEAFARVYGHPPVSANDWLMAAALDPHSYLPKDHGVAPQIVAGRFTPQPGRGVVRSNMFIPTDQVQNVAKDATDVEQGRLFPMNFGDNRGPSATADPEASRVSMFVDYDHGLIVVRQNPTGNVDGSRGGAAADVPSVHVAEAPDGRLTIDYNAHDAYENVAGTAAGMTVNGHVTLSPQPGGAVSLGGSTTIYPSMETYQYRDGQPPAQLQWNPANSGSEWGPSTSLARHHWVGDATIPTVRPDMPGWQWELENLNPFEGDPFLSHTTQLADPFSGGIPAVAAGR
ncbi:WXG100 family type VII secretion target [Mycobacterium cookii]|nr:hypothetical protein [Mycobacterium cookii]MCV7333281.1 hypothetical protein [Mycobacterium cookii]